MPEGMGPCTKEPAPGRQTPVRQSRSRRPGPTSPHRRPGEVVGREQQRADDAQVPALHERAAGVQHAARRFQRGGLADAPLRRPAAKMSSGSIPPGPMPPPPWCEGRAVRWLAATPSTTAKSSTDDPESTDVTGGTGQGGIKVVKEFEPL